MEPYDLICILKESLSALLKKKKRPWISGSKCRIKQLFQETTAIVQARGSEKGDSSRGGEKCGTLNTF